MKYISTPSEFISRICSLGPVQHPCMWSDDGRMLGNSEANSRYIRSLPNALFTCQCDARHHMVGPRISQSYLRSEPDGTFPPTKVEFEVSIYGHYLKENWLGTTRQYFLVRCEDAFVSLVSSPLNGGLFSNRNIGKVEFTSNQECLEALINFNLLQKVTSKHKHSIVDPEYYLRLAEDM